MDEELKQRILEKFGKGHSYKELDNFLSEVLKEGIQQMLKLEMDEHLGYEKHAPESVQFENSRNGKSRKTIKSKSGALEIEVPRDRQGSFEPVLVPKRKRVLDDIEDHILSLYTYGMSTRDIESHMKEIYGLTFSEASISNITDKIIDHIEAFKTRRLDPLYYIVWMDAIVFKVRQDGKVIDKAVQIAVGLNEHGKKEVLGMWLCQNESAAFWMQVLTTLKARGVQDILITATDNLKGFTEAITSVFPLALTQVCIVHQLRNSLKFVVWKDKKAVVSALQAIYNAPDRESAYRYLETFDQSWSKKYPYIAKSWMANWDNLTTFFEFPAEIRKIMYTTNIIENLNRLISKYTKTKSMLPNDQAVEKVVYLALMQASKKWTMPARNWPLMLTQFINKFGEERCNLKI